MELKVFRDTITTVGQLCNTLLEVPIETEVLIPDYLPAVFKVVKTLVHRVVLQKQLTSGRLTAEGYFRVEILYQSETQELCTVEQKVAFSKQLELKNTEDVVCRVETGGALQYINCRAISQRRLDIHGAYNLEVRVLADVRQEVITALAEQGIQQKTCQIPAMRIFSSREKQFTLEEAINLEAPPAFVLHTHMVPVVHEVRLISGEAAAKGELQITVVYRAENEKELRRKSVALPFNQVVELEADAEDCQCQVSVELVGCTIFAASEEDGTRISATCLLSVKAVRQMEYVSVSDCFSTLCKTDVVRREVTTDVLLDLLSNTVTATAQGKLPDDDLRILDCYADCTEPEPVAEDGQTAIRGKAVVHLICADSLGEIECYDKNCEYYLPKRYEGLPEDLTIALETACQDVTVSQKQGDVSAELSVQLSGMVCRRQKSDVVGEVTCQQPLEKEDSVALRVYYAGKGEQVFDIAKRYHASPALIASLGSIEGDVLNQDARLLIPTSG